MGPASQHSSPSFVDKVLVVLMNRVPRVYQTHLLLLLFLVSVACIS